MHGRVWIAAGGETSTESCHEPAVDDIQTRDFGVASLERTGQGRKTHAGRANQAKA
jgi:hypothetical protein